MASFSRKTGIIGALIIAGVLIGGSILLSVNGLAFLNPNSANAESTQALLQAYAARDTDHDGLPDWQEALYGLDPNNAHSFSPTVTDGQAVAQGLVKPKFVSETASSSTTIDPSTLEGPTAAPGSLTEQFSQSLFSQYLNQVATNGANLSDDAVAPFAQGVLQTFAQTHSRHDAYAIGQVQLGGTGPTAMKSYAASVEKALAANTTSETKSELDYFSDAIEKNDPTALAKIATIGKDYTSLAPMLMQIQVPTEAQNAHLEIANAANRLGGDITDLSTMNTDPLRAYLGLAQYQNDATTLAKGFSDLATVFEDEQLTFSKGDPGYFVYNASIKIQASQGNGSPASNVQN